MKGAGMCKRLSTLAVVVLGGVFVLSSLFKWIGIRTFALTVEQFAEYLGMPLLQGYGLLVAVLICTGELALGVAALVLRTRDYARWGLLLSMMGFTIITWLNYTDRYGQIESCGCFGEVIHLTPSTSFYKNVVLLALSLLSMAKYIGKGAGRGTILCGRHQV